MSDLRDTDGTRLLFADEVAAKAGLEAKTVNYYNAVRRRKRKPHERTPPNLLPPPVKSVKRKFRKANGQSAVIWAKLWREDQIDAWIAARKGRKAA